MKNDPPTLPELLLAAKRGYVSCKTFGLRADGFRLHKDVFSLVGETLQLQRFTVAWGYAPSLSVELRFT